MMKSKAKNGLEVREIMTSHPISLDVDASIRDAANILLEKDIRHIPVVKDNELVGMISDRDLRSYVLPLETQALSKEESEERLNSHVSKVLQDDVISVYPGTPVTELIDTMIDQKIGAVPVVDEESMKVLGIVSYIDILKVAQDYL